MSTQNNNTKKYPKQAIACVAAVVLSEKNGEKFILIQERWKLGGSEYNGRIEIPAGVLDIEYENVIDAVKREVMEEVSIEVTEVVGINETLHKFSNGDKMLEVVPFCISQQIVGGKAYVCNAFICKAEKTEPKNQDTETRNPRWIKLTELEEILKFPDNFFPLSYPILMKFKNLYE